MSRELFVVEDCFELEGRGIVLGPGLQPIENEAFKVGDPLLLKRPDGNELRVAIAGLGFLDPNPSNVTPVLLKGINKQDLPIGTSVWSVDD